MLDQVRACLHKCNVNVLEGICKLRDCTKHVSHHESRARANFGDREASRRINAAIVVLQCLQHPYPKRLSEHLRDLRTRGEVTTFAEDLVLGRVVSMLGMLQTELHETSQRHGYTTANSQFVFNHCLQGAGLSHRGIAALN